MSDFSENIKIIVGLDKLEATVKELGEKVAILSRTATSYQDSSGGVNTIPGLSAAGVQAVSGTIIGPNASVTGGQGDDSDDDSSDDSDSTNTHGGGPASQTPLGNDILGGVFQGVNSALANGLYDISDLLNPNGNGGPVIGSDQVLSGVIGGLTQALEALSLYEQPNFVPPPGYTDINTPDMTDPNYIQDFYLGYHWPLYSTVSGGIFGYTSSMLASVGSHFNRNFGPAGQTTGDRYSLGDSRISYDGTIPTASSDIVQYLRNNEPYGPITLTDVLQTTAVSCAVGSDESCPVVAPRPFYNAGPGVRLYKDINGTFRPDGQDIVSASASPGAYNNQYGPSTIIGAYYDDGIRKFFKRTPTKNGGFMYGEIAGTAAGDQAYLPGKYVHVFDVVGHQTMVIPSEDAGTLLPLLL